VGLLLLCAAALAAWHVYLFAFNGEAASLHSRAGNAGVWERGGISEGEAISEGDGPVFAARKSGQSPSSQPSPPPYEARPCFSETLTKPVPCAYPLKPSADPPASTPPWGLVGQQPSPSDFRLVPPAGAIPVQGPIASPPQYGGTEPPIGPYQLAGNPPGIAPPGWQTPDAPPERVAQIPWGLVRQLPEVFSGDRAPGFSKEPPLLSAGARVKIPLARSIPPEAVQVDPRSGLVTICVRDAPLNQVLEILAEQQGLNVVCSEDVTARISITVNSAPFEEAMDAILSVAGYTARRQGDFLMITSVANKGKVSPQAQGREVRVFVLNYVSAADADVVVKGLLSPVGQSFLTESDEQDRRKTQELVVVEDLPTYLSRIEEVVRQLDVPPRQVLIESHVMSIELKDNCHHGIDLSYLKEANPALTLKTAGFGDAEASPAMIFDLDTGELAALVECLQTTTDAKTLASPKVFALNGQQARIQVGQQLGYRVVTTTQTSTMENVDFLEVGVILTVTPQITPDNCVLMKVKPVVSTGQINPDTELPEEETTEVETSLILRDGHGIVIGGLIQEEDVETQQKVPLVGDLWLVGRLFQKRQIDRKRTELIVTLIPHIVPYQPECCRRESDQFYRATTPIVEGPLLPYPRPFEPSLPDAGQPPACLSRP
jgi:type IV pilus assembly protein PilQ